jgi:ethanolamine ammonia-lyase small subunit
MAAGDQPQSAPVSRTALSPALAGSTTLGPALAGSTTLGPAPTGSTTLGTAPSGSAALATGLAAIRGEAQARASRRQRLDAELARFLGRPLAEMTPARVFTGNIGGAYSTSTLLGLVADQAVARHAVKLPLDLTQPGVAELIERYGVYEVRSAAPDLATHLADPTRGRRLSDKARETVRTASSPRLRSPSLQLVIGDGLSAAAVHAQVPALLPCLIAGARERGWQLGRPFAVRFCRVGALGDVGALTGADVVVLLIGERPGLGTSESLSAYLEWRPDPAHTDADRNVISNIHARGLQTEPAAARILALVEAIFAAGASGIAVHAAEPALPARL